jgi:hypothetical protein
MTFVLFIPQSAIRNPKFSQLYYLPSPSDPVKVKILTLYFTKSNSILIIIKIFSCFGKLLQGKGPGRKRRTCHG